MVIVLFFILFKSWKKLLLKPLYKNCKALFSTLPILLVDLCLKMPDQGAVVQVYIYKTFYHYFLRLKIQIIFLSI